MALITENDFVDSIKLAQLGDAIVAKALQQRIDRMQPEFLQKVLGSFGATVVLPQYDLNSKYVSLRKYLSYAFARYVYWHYMDDANLTSTPSGKANMAQENATKTSIVYSQTKAWNEMIAKLQDMYVYIQSSGNYTDDFNISMATPFYVQNRFGI